jgi:uncharacterized cupredoxin-like copper-binding protein
MRLHRLTVSLVAVAALAGCGGSDSSGSSGTGSGSGGAQAPAETTTTPPADTQASSGAASRSLTVGMSEFKFDPKDAVAKAGEVKVTAKNDGSTVHELVLLKTDADPANLPKKNGEVDESTSVGEVADVASGASKSKTLKLAAGRYVMVCALPGHYEAGMYGTLTVK